MSQTDKTLQECFFALKAKSFTNHSIQTHSKEESKQRGSSGQKPQPKIKTLRNNLALKQDILWGPILQVPA